MSSVYGYAIKDEQGIFIKTVSDTEKAAKINYLVVEHSIMVTVGYTDTHINNLFKKIQEQYKAECVKVLIQEA